jgi:hypothetical protein
VGMLPLQGMARSRDHDREEGPDCFGVGSSFGHIPTVTEWVGSVVSDVFPVPPEHRVRLEISRDPFIGSFSKHLFQKIDLWELRTLRTFQEPIHFSSEVRLLQDLRTMRLLGTTASQCPSRVHFGPVPLLPFPPISRLQGLLPHRFSLFSCSPSYPFRLRTAIGIGIPR